jgi:GntR family transcriptional regulator
MINKNSPIPLYHQIKEDIIAKIASNELVEGQKIESESEFVRLYGVSQITIRKALSDLMTEGYLNRIRGKGTFVSNKRTRHKTSLISFTDEMRQLGYVSDIHVLEIKSESNSRIAEILGVNKTEKLIKVQRVRLGNGEPVGLQTSYIPQSRIGIDVFRDFHQVKSLYKVLENVGIQPKRVREKYRAVQIWDGTTQKLLNVPSGASAFYVERYGYDEDGILFEYTESILRGDKYELETETFDKD